MNNNSRLFAYCGTYIKLSFHSYESRNVSDDPIIKRFIIIDYFVIKNCDTNNLYLFREKIQIADIFHLQFRLVKEM